MEKYIVKIGGSVATYKEKNNFPVDSLNEIVNSFERYFRRKVVERLAKEVYSALKEKEFSLILLNGAGPFGHALVKKYSTTNEGYSKLIHDSVEYLNKNITEIFQDKGLQIRSCAPFDTCKFADGEYHISGMWNQMRDVKEGVIPSSYGDMVPLLNKIGVEGERKEKNVVDDTIVISADDIASNLSRLWNPDKIIMVSSEDYVASADTNKYENPMHYTKIIIKERGIEFSGIANDFRDVFENERKTKEKEKIIKKDVTGGMETKAIKLYKAVMASITDTKGQIINGLKLGNLKKALLGDEEIGTLITKKIRK